MNKVLVIGAARSGIEVSKLLNKHGYEVYLSDMKAISVKDDLANAAKALEISVDKSLKVKYYDNNGLKMIGEFE